MGYMRHHAIIVTTWNSELLGSAHSELLGSAHEIAREIFGEAVTPILPASINGYQTFLVGPDGSKEGWDESDEGDDRRSRFVAWLADKQYDDGSTPLDWVEVQYGDDEGVSKVTRHSHAHLAADA